MNRREDVFEAYGRLMDYIAGSAVWSLSPLKREAVDWGVSIQPEDPTKTFLDAQVLEAICPYPLDDHQIEVAHRIAEKLRLFDLVDCVRVSERVYDDMSIR